MSKLEMRLIDLLASLAKKNHEVKHQMEDIDNFMYFKGRDESLHDLAVELEQLGLNGLFQKYNIQ